MSVKFIVELKAKDIYDYTLHRYYTSFAGLASGAIGAFSLWAAIARVVAGYWEASVMYWAFVFVTFLYFPYLMWTKSKKQYKNNESFQHPIEYTFSEQGITVVQGEINVTNEWEIMEKAVSTQRNVFIYTSKVRAVIFPKRCMGEQYEEIVKMIHTHMPAKKVKIRHIH